MGTRESHHGDDMEKLARVLQGMIGFGNSRVRLQYMVDQIAALLGAALVGIWMEEKTDLIPVAVGGRAADYGRALVFSTREDAPGGQGPSGRAFRERRTVLYDPLRESDNQWQELRERYVLGTSLAVPLVYEHQVFGIIGLYVTRGKSIQPRMRHMMEILAPVLSMMIKDQRDRMLLEERSKGLSTLISAIQVLGRVQSEEELMTEFGDIAIQVLGANGGYIILYDKEKRPSLKMFGLLTGYEGELAPLLMRLMRVNPPRGDWLSEPFNYRQRRGRYRDILAQLQFRSGISGQLRVDGELAGVFTLWSYEPDFFNNKQYVLRALAEEVSTALELLRVRHRLIAGAQTDPLTGLANRTGLQEKFDELVAEGRRYTWPFLFVLLDLDHFKQINDTQGHPEGDRLLRVVADHLRRAVRPFDVASRLGGDEFALLLARCSPQTEGIQKRLAALLGELSRAFEGLGVSAGVAAFPEDGDEFRELYRAADQRLYEAKRRGRGRIAWPDDVFQPL
ncbi:GGDEF domain-containing protein [Kyrpidia tusciae]|uniref:Diguanylate cyclase with GAF sensor n=1 Tax=Kyrpidia tusciae (strain DSM 2912 / NBRC 15312 / T2) TaxID=562970 RepID=D5WWK1_KYRT2|nr:sensor domain-containing diguanylate cyclase [Kyrpidia tusciae]ADG07766.1 diguanylate cyclase with GAF sensor [Kyrpidia tusciae DSM 2912]